MSLTGAKYQEAKMGQYGSTLLHGDGKHLDLSRSTSTKFICAITFLTDTTFQDLENANGSHLQNACISTVDGEDEIRVPWGDAQTAEANNYAIIVTTSHVFPKGVTIYGNWDKVELNSGSCILYLAPTGRSVELVDGATP
tara:strand:- start:354 stop:773 length:420 start_codon:yes stop_codon:yes gene_type:complete